MIEVPASGGTIVDPEQARAVVARVCTSEGMRRSQRLRDFLAYVVEETLAGRGGDITEAGVATQVFGRRPDYNPSSDNIVRVQARILRQKLTEYFEGAGAGEPLQVEIPKGGYVPAFVTRPAEPVPLAAEPAHLSADVALRDLTGPPDRRFPVLAVITSVLACSTVFLLWRVYVHSSVGAGTVASAVVRPGQRTLAVLPDLSLVVASVLTGKSFPLEKYANPNAYRNELINETSTPDARQAFGYLLSKRLTDSFAAGFYGQLTSLFPGPSPRLELRHPRTLQLDELRGVNVILAGSPRSNPWVDAFRNEMTFRFAARGSGGEIIENLRPQGSEPREFVVPAMNAGSGKALALLTLVPNPHPPGRVLIVAGTAMGATQVASNIVVNRLETERLEELIGASFDQVKSAEIVLSIDVVGDSGAAWTVLARHVTR